MVSGLTGGAGHIFSWGCLRVGSLTGNYNLLPLLNNKRRLLHYRKRMVTIYCVTNRSVGLCGRSFVNFTLFLKP